MSASARGTAAQPGSKVAQKAGLNRGILDAAWGEFTRQLTYKLEWRGGRVILVNPAYTSRPCRLCLREAAENRKTQSVFSCAACGHTENADVHAAKNILAAGYAVWLGERTASAPSTDACGGVVRRERPQSEARSSSEAGTHRSKGVGMSKLSNTCAAGISVPSGRRGCQPGWNGAVRAGAAHA